MSCRGHGPYHCPVALAVVSTPAQCHGLLLALSRSLANEESADKGAPDANEHGPCRVVLAILALPVVLAVVSAEVAVADANLPFEAVGTLALTVAFAFAPALALVIAFALALALVVLAVVSAGVAVAMQTCPLKLSGLLHLTVALLLPLPLLWKSLLALPCPSPTKRRLVKINGASP